MSQTTFFYVFSLECERIIARGYVTGFFHAQPVYHGWRAGSIKLLNIKQTAAIVVVKILGDVALCGRPPFRRILTDYSSNHVTRRTELYFQHM